VHLETWFRLTFPVHGINVNYMTALLTRASNPQKIPLQSAKGEVIE
jgi:hypothetical protein